jgi:hypothetical protein
MHLLVLMRKHRSIVVGRDVVTKPPIVIGVVVRRNRFTLISRYLG